jgi:hypothetical protein
LKFGF